MTNIMKASQVLEEQKEKAIKISSFNLMEEVEKHIQAFLKKHKERCDQIKKEGWLGEEFPRGARGILGYMRTSYAIQLAVINKVGGAPIYPENPKIVRFFKSNFIKDIALQRNCVSDIYKKEHFDLIKQEMIGDSNDSN